MQRRINEQGTLTERKKNKMDARVYPVLIRKNPDKKPPWGFGAGATLVHISAQPEPVLVVSSTASVHLPAQLVSVTETHNLAYKKCSRQTEKGWRCNAADHKMCLR
jgi:hypothetical protein